MSLLQRLACVTLICLDARTHPADQLAFTLGRPAHVHVELQAWGTYMVPEDIRILGSARNAFSKLWVAEPMNGADIESDRPLPLYHRE